MAPSNSTIASVTSNSSEMRGGGDTVINFAPVINAQEMDADALANLMAKKVLDAVSEARDPCT